MNVGPALPLSPAAAPAPYRRMLWAQTRLEVVLTLRRGESILLALGIPVLLLGFFGTVDVLPTGGLAGLVPGLLALAIMSSSFTGLAIATAYERSYGALRRLGATPMPRAVLLAGKAAAVAVVEVGQVAVITAVALALGWSPAGNPLAVAAVCVLGSAAFAGLGLLIAGRLRAEAVLAGANGLWLVLLLGGGLLVPLDRLPRWLAVAGGALPSAPLAHALRAVLRSGHGLPAPDLLALAGWAVGLIAAAALTFRWE